VLSEWSSSLTYTRSIDQKCRFPCNADDDTDDTDDSVKADKAAASCASNSYSVACEEIWTGEKSKVTKPTLFDNQTPPNRTVREFSVFTGRFVTNQISAASRELASD
jgi:hypothetical protein